MRILSGLAVRSHEVKDRGPVKTTVLQKPIDLIDKERLATVVGHEDNIPGSAVIDGECAPDVLTVVAKRVSNYMALIRIRATPTGSEAERVALRSTHVRNRRSLAGNQVAAPSESPLGARHSLDLDVLVHANVGLAERDLSWADLRQDRADEREGGKDKSDREVHCVGCSIEGEVNSFDGETSP